MQAKRFLDTASRRLGGGRICQEPSGQASLLAELRKDLLDLRHRQGSGFLAFEDRLVALVEIARTDRAYLGKDDNVGVLDLRHCNFRVHNVDGLEHRIDDPLGNGTRDTRRDINGDDNVGARFPGCIHGNRTHDAAVHVSLVADLDGLEDPRDGTARPNGLARISRRENRLLARLEVRGNGAEGDLQPFQWGLADHSIDKILQLLAIRHGKFFNDLHHDRNYPGYG